MENNAVSLPEKKAEKPNKIKTKIVLWTSIIKRF